MMHTMPHRNPWHPLHRTLLPDGFVCIKLAAADYPDHPAEVHFPASWGDWSARWYRDAVIHKKLSHTDALLYAYSGEPPSALRVIPR